MEGARREKSETALQAKICKYLVIQAQLLLNTQTVFAEKPERGDQFWYRIYKRGPSSYPREPRNYQNNPTGETKTSFINHGHHIWTKTFQEKKFFFKSWSSHLHFFRTSLMGSVSQTQYLESCWPSQWRSTETLKISSKLPPKCFWRYWTSLERKLVWMDLCNPFCHASNNIPLAQNHKGTKYHLAKTTWILQNVLCAPLTWYDDDTMSHKTWA